MSKFVFSDDNARFDIEDALTITKGVWADGNPNGESRLYRFVTSDNNGLEVSIANENSYVCGVSVDNQAFLGRDNDTRHCVVQSMGVCIVQSDGSLKVGDKCMPNYKGIAIKSTNDLGYRVVEKVDSIKVKIIIAPNNDMIQRIKKDTDSIKSSVSTNVTNHTITRNTTNTSAISSYSKCYSYKIGGKTFVTLNMYVTRKVTFAANTEYVLATIPSEARPRELTALAFYAAVDSTGACPLAYVNATGNIVVRMNNVRTDATAWRLSGTWVRD